MTASVVVNLDIHGNNRMLSLFEVTAGLPSIINQEVRANGWSGDSASILRAGASLNLFYDALLKISSNDLKDMSFDGVATSFGNDSIDYFGKCV